MISLQNNAMVVTHQFKALLGFESLVYSDASEIPSEGVRWHGQQKYIHHSTFQSHLSFLLCEETASGAANKAIDCNFLSSE
jgi:hypothetical protein